jgi:hypothetical protein
VKYFPNRILPNPAAADVCGGEEEKEAGEPFVGAPTAVKPQPPVPRMSFAAKQEPDQPKMASCLPCFPLLHVTHLFIVVFPLHPRASGEHRVPLLAVELNLRAKEENWATLVKIEPEFPTCLHRAAA